MSQHDFVRSPPHENSVDGSEEWLRVVAWVSRHPPRAIFEIGHEAVETHPDAVANAPHRSLLKSAEHRG